MTANAIDRIAPAAPVTQTTAVEQARAVAEVAAAVQVAQSCPRNMDRVWSQMRDACSRFGLASRAFYSLPNRGSDASVHLARELCRIFGNFDQGVRELYRDDAAGQSEIQAFAWDQETNYRASRTFQVPHRRMGGGAKLTDQTEIYLNNQNVGARALRECIFAALPADFVDEAKDLCRKTLERGDGKPLVERINEMVAAFAAIGVTELQIETRLKRGRSRWTPEDVADLGVVFRSIKRRESTADDEFPPARVTAEEIRQHSPDLPPAGQRDLHLFTDEQAKERLAAEGYQWEPGQHEAIRAPQRLGEAAPAMCRFATPDGPCNLAAGHPTGPELPGFDGHDVVPEEPA